MADQRASSRLAHHQRAIAVQSPTARVAIEPGEAVALVRLVAAEEPAHRGIERERMQIGMVRRGRPPEIVGSGAEHRFRIRFDHSNTSTA